MEREPTEFEAYKAGIQQRIIKAAAELMGECGLLRMDSALIANRAKVPVHYLARYTPDETQLYMQAAAHIHTGQKAVLLAELEKPSFLSMKGREQCLFLTDYMVQVALNQYTLVNSMMLMYTRLHPSREEDMASYETNDEILLHHPGPRSPFLNALFLRFLNNGCNDGSVPEKLRNDQRLCELIIITILGFCGRLAMDHAYIIADKTPPEVRISVYSRVVEDALAYGLD